MAKRKQQLPQIDTAKFIPPWQDTKRRLSAILRQALQFKEKYAQGVAHLSQQQLFQSLEELSPIQKGLAELIHIKEFLQNKYPDRPNTAVATAAIEHCENETSKLFDDYFLGMVNLDDNQMNALQKNPEFKRYNPFLQYLSILKIRQEKPLPQEQRKQISERMHFHADRLLPDSAPDKIFRVTIRAIAEAAQRGYKNPFDNIYATAFMATSEVNALSTVLKDKTQLLKEYAQHRGLVFSPLKSRYPIVDQPGEMSWQAATDISIESASSISAHLGKITKGIFDQGLVNATPGRYHTNTVTVSSSHSGFPFVFTGFDGSYFNVQDLCHVLGYAVYYMERTKAGEVRPFHSVCIDSIFPDLLERSFWESVGQRNVPDLDTQLHSVDNVVSHVIRYALLNEFRQASFELCETKENWHAQTLNKIWGDLHEKYYGVSPGPQDADGWKIAISNPRPFWELTSIYSQLVAERLWQEYRANPAAFEKKLLSFLQEGGTKSPSEMLAHFGIDTSSPRFWESTYAGIEEAVRGFRKMPSSGTNDQPTQG